MSSWISLALVIFARGAQDTCGPPYRLENSTFAQASDPAGSHSPCMHYVAAASCSTVCRFTPFALNSEWPRAELRRAQLPVGKTAACGLQRVSASKRWRNSRRASDSRSAADRAASIAAGVNAIPSVLNSGHHVVMQSVSHCLGSRGSFGVVLPRGCDRSAIVGLLACTSLILGSGSGCRRVAFEQAVQGRTDARWPTRPAVPGLASRLTRVCTAAEVAADTTARSECCAAATTRGRRHSAERTRSAWFLP